MAQFLFFLLAIICIAAVLGMIISKDQAYNALFLIVAFVCTGGLFGLLDAPFIAAVQIIIYAGAIMILFIFVVMMINLRKGLEPEKKKWTLYFAVIVAAVLVIELVLTLKGALQPAGSPAIAEYRHTGPVDRSIGRGEVSAITQTGPLIISSE